MNEVCSLKEQVRTVQKAAQWGEWETQAAEARVVDLGHQLEQAEAAFNKEGLARKPLESMRLANRKQTRRQAIRKQEARQQDEGAAHRPRPS